MSVVTVQILPVCQPPGGMLFPFYTYGMEHREVKEADQSHTVGLDEAKEPGQLNS